MATAHQRLDLRKAKALLVDDNPQSLELLSQVLTGFRMREMKACRSVAEAREILTTQRFDVILADLDMPDEDGLTLVRQIRSETRAPNYTTPIIILHGFTPAGMVHSARDAGANMVVRKPIAPSVLLSRLEWIARSNREFITADGYNGPDRRFRQVPLAEDQQERRAEALALIADPTRALSQDDISALFD